MFNLIPQQPHRALWDPELVLRRIGGDARLLRTLAAFFRRDAPGLVHDLQDAVERGDARTAMHTAHSLKLQCANLDATQAAQVALEMECAARYGDLATVETLRHELGQLVENIIASIETIYPALRTQQTLNDLSLKLNRRFSPKADDVSLNHGD